MYRFSKNEKDILKSAYKNLAENSEHRNTFLMKNSELAVYINALTLSLKYEFNLTLKGEFAAESLV